MRQQMHAKKHLHTSLGAHTEVYAVRCIALLA